jgi:hypothetical protein
VTRRDRRIGRSAEQAGNQQRHPRRQVHVVIQLAESAASHSDGFAPWIVAILTFGSIIVLGIVLTLMTLAERRRHPHV